MGSEKMGQRSGCKDHEFDTNSLQGKSNKVGFLGVPAAISTDPYKILLGVVFIAGVIAFMFIFK